MGIREEQKEQRRQQILYSALELFVLNGFAATKITDIAKKASMSTGLLFHYFDSKEQLYEELVRFGLEAMRYPLQIEGDLVTELLEIFVTQLFGYIQENTWAAYFFVLMAEAQRNRGLPSKARELACSVNTIKAFVPLIKLGQEQGAIREGNPITLSNAFWSSIQGIAEQYVTHPEMELPEPCWILDIIKK